ncbi:hypothetical protein QBC45DRAFT_42603 [Copromyces sp. CBS 386.78]|nr:hypothetical protein QBC45DRAFT_42603 [Copromyces sp. CBS 386.78]
MHRPSRLVFALLLFVLTLSSAFPLAKCPPIPHWTLLSVNVTYSNDTYTPGVVSLEVQSSTTNTTDLFTCDLQFNSICLPDETRLPSDRNVLVRFYINIELARITLTGRGTVVVAKEGLGRQKRRGHSMPSLSASSIWLVPRLSRRT